jgi:hypothetical protein
MSGVICGANRIEEGAYPTDGVICFDCCLSREIARIAPNLCLEAGTVMQLDPLTDLWSPASATAGSIASVPAGTRFGILFCAVVNTMDGKPGDCVVVSYHAKVKPNLLTWPTGYVRADKVAVLNYLRNNQHIQAILAV